MTHQTFLGFLRSIASTVIGGVLLAFLFFLSREIWFPLPNITGKWHVEMRTSKTAYEPYEDMVLRYVATAWREGSVIKGTVEKVYENSSTGEREYVGENRTRGRVEGHIDKRYFSKDRVSLHIVEDGHGRESTSFHELVVQRNASMTGTFFAMAADSQGEVTWQREPF